MNVDFQSPRLIIRCVVLHALINLPHFVVADLDLMR